MAKPTAPAPSLDLEAPPAGGDIDVPDIDFGDSSGPVVSQPLLLPVGGDSGLSAGDLALRSFMQDKASLLDGTQAAQAAQKSTNEGVPFDKACVQLEFITEQQLVNALTEECYVPHLQVRSYEVRKKALDTVDEQDARRYSVLPVDKLGKILNLAMVNPLDDDAIEFLQDKTGLEIKKVVASRSEIEEGIDLYYGGSQQAREGSMSIAQDAPARSSRPAVKIPLMSCLKWRTSMNCCQVAKISLLPRSTPSSSLPMSLKMKSSLSLNLPTSPRLLPKAIHRALT